MDFVRFTTGFMKKRWKRKNSKHEILEPLKLHGGLSLKLHQIAPKNQEPRSNCPKKYAAVKVQKVYRGYMARKLLWSEYGLMAHLYSVVIQRHIRGVLGRKLAQRKRDELVVRNVKVIQRWWWHWRRYEMEKVEIGREINRKLIKFQAVYRGFLAKKVYRVMYLRHCSLLAVKIQCVIRKYLSKKKVEILRVYKRRQFKHLARTAEIHLYISRCGRCNYKKATENSLLDCLMARYLGLHDFQGAKALALDGICKFPNCSVFSFVYATLLMVTCEPLEIAMQFLEKAKNMPHVQMQYSLSSWCDVLDRTYYGYALKLWPDDAAVELDYAVFLQCTQQTQRALKYYRMAMAKNPNLYTTPGYVHRKHMAFRITLNFKIFTSLFHSKDKPVIAYALNVKNECLDLEMVQFHQYFVIQCVYSQDQEHYNKIYLLQEEVAYLTKKLNQGYYVVEQVHRNTNGANNKRKSTRKSQAIPPAQPIHAVERRQARKCSISLPNDFVKDIEDRAKGKHVTAGTAINIIRMIIVIPVNGKPGGMLIIPAIEKQRQRFQFRKMASRSCMIIQSVFRGWSTRTFLRYEHSLAAMKQVQMKAFQQKLLRNQQYRDDRTNAAIKIQSTARRRQTVQRLRQMHKNCTKIQSMIRRCLAVQRIARLRLNHESGRPEEVKLEYFRGHTINDKHIMLKMERCGLSWQFTGYDLMDCTTYHGILPGNKFKALLNYHCYITALGCVGEGIIHNGRRGIVHRVLECDTRQAFDLHEESSYHLPVEIECTFDDQSTPQILSLEQVILAMRFFARQHNKNVKATTGKYRMPIQKTNTNYVLEMLLSWLALLPSSFGPAAQSTLVIVAPQSAEPQPRYVPKPLFKSPKTLHKLPVKVHIPTTLRIDSQLHPERSVYFNTLDKENLDNKVHRLENVHSKGHSCHSKHSVYRSSCPSHQLRFTRCHCFLAPTSIPVHLSALSRAISTSTIDNSITTIEKNPIPNSLHRMWQLPQDLNDRPGVCHCDHIFCTCIF